MNRICIATGVLGFGALGCSVLRAAGLNEAGMRQHASRFRLWGSGDMVPLSKSYHLPLFIFKNIELISRKGLLTYHLAIDSCIRDTKS